jgi:hypothetical protein
MPTPRKLRRLISVRQLNKKISYALAKLGGIGSGGSSNISGSSSGGSFGGGGFSGGGASGGW